MAALDVVYNNLQRSGLELFCLKAHSQSANKKEVVADLDKTLSAVLSASQQSALESALRDAATGNAELEVLRDQLNRYVSALHQRRGALGATYFQAAGNWSLLHAAPDSLAALPPALATDEATRQKRRVLSAEINSLSPVWRLGAAHVWHGAHEQNVSLDLVSSLRLRGAQGARLGRELVELCAQLAARCGVASAPFSPARAAHLLAGARLLDESPRVPQHWLSPNVSLHDLGATARAFKMRYDALAQRRAVLDEKYAALWWDLAHEELVATARERFGETLERGGTWDDWADWGEEVASRLERVARGLAHSDALARALCARLQIEAPPNLARAGALANALGVLENEWLLPARRARETWFEAANAERLLALARTASEHLQARNAAAAQLERYHLQLLGEIDCVAMRDRFARDYHGFTRIFKGAFRADCAQLTTARQGLKADYHKMLAELEIAAAWQENRRALENLHPELTKQFGRFFAGDATDWPAIEATLEACMRLNGAMRDCGGTSAQLRAALDERGDLASLLELSPELRRELAALRDDWQWLPQLFSLRDLPFQENASALAPAQAPLLPLSQWLSAHAANLRAIENALQVLAQARHEPKIAYRPSQLCDDASEAAQIKNAEAILRTESVPLSSDFQQFFAGAQTQWNQVFAALNWAHRARQWWQKDTALQRAASTCSAENAPASTCSTENEANSSASTCIDAALQPSPAFINLARETGASRATTIENVRALAARLDEELNWFDALFLQPLAREQNLDECSAALEKWGANAGELEAYARWMGVQREIGELGLKAFWDEARARDWDENMLWPALEKRFWTSWLDEAASEDAALARFVGARHQAVRARFEALDAQSLCGAQQRLRSELWAKKPHSNSLNSNALNAGGEIAVLRREARKKARHKPLRQLFREMPHLLRALKPCVLMSPLAIAQFMEAERAHFDVLIFDEASQICPEDAVGAMMRAAQIIVVGDRKQLPPTRFFSAANLADDESEEESFDDGIYESILDACAPHLPNYLLSWHYRSRDEALIAFSNRHFYEDKLITFPNAQRAASAGRGVRFVQADGVYIRGKSRAARTNPREAERVAELVFEHIERAPDASLGVIALNAQQARAIENAVERIRELRPAREAFFVRAGDEKFFVKALENVQGDERDAIILSIGYGPDEHGKISLNFGPINREGGERRLNVAVTRARESLCVVASMAPEAIDLSRTQRLGPRLLREYLEMARRGGDAELRLAAADAAREDVMDLVASRLRERGYEVAQRVGQSALRVDVAVAHSHEPERFVLGIECDGPDYALAPMARDRDRIRPAMLRSLGWNLWRVWTPEWLKNPDAQLERILHALENPAATETVASEDEEPSGASVELAALDQTLPTSTFLDGEANVAFDGDADEAPQVLATPEFEAASQEAEFDDGVQIYRAAELGIVGDGDEFRVLVARHAPKLRDIIVEVVEIEGPIASAVLARRVARAFGFARVGDMIVGGIMATAQREARASKGADY